MSNIKNIFFSFSFFWITLSFFGQLKAQDKVLIFVPGPSEVTNWHKEANAIFKAIKKEAVKKGITAIFFSQPFNESSRPQIIEKLSKKQASVINQQYIQNAQDNNDTQVKIVALELQAHIVSTYSSSGKKVTLISYGEGIQIIEKTIPQLKLYIETTLGGINLSQIIEHVFTVKSKPKMLPRDQSNMAEHICHINAQEEDGSTETSAGSPNSLDLDDEIEFFNADNIKEVSLWDIKSKPEEDDDVGCGICSGSIFKYLRRLFTKQNLENVVDVAAFITDTVASTQSKNIKNTIENTIEKVETTSKQNIECSDKKTEATTDKTIISNQNIEILIKETKSMADTITTQTQK